MADCIGQNPLFLVNGFIKAGIMGALDGQDPLLSRVQDTLPPIFNKGTKVQNPRYKCITLKAYTSAQTKTRP